MATRRKQPTRNKNRTQAARQRVAKANAIAKAKASALTRIGLLEGGTAKKVLAPLKGGTRAASGQTRYLRRKVAELYDKVNVQLFDEALKPLPKARVVKAVPVTPGQAIQVAGQDYTVLKRGRQAFAIVRPTERVKKSGEVIDRTTDMVARAFNITADDLEENENGVSPLYRKIKRKVDQQKRNKAPGRLGFYFTANRDQIRNIPDFDSPDAMYEYLMRYGNETLERVGGIVLLTYKGAVDIAKETGAHIKNIRNSQQKLLRETKRKKKRAELTDRQKEHARLMERRRYAQRKYNRKK